MLEAKIGPLPKWLLYLLLGAVGSMLGLVGPCQCIVTGLVSKFDYNFTVTVAENKSVWADV